MKHALALVLLFAETTAGPRGELAHAQKAGLPVVLPTVVPPGAALVGVELPKSAEGPSYLAVYRVGKGPVGFAIESAAGGIGDLISDREPVGKFRPKALAATFDAGLYWHLTGGAGSARSWYSEWVLNKGGTHAYRLTGVGQLEAKQRKLYGVSQDVSKAWAVKIGNSLAPWRGAP